jgi:endonuclease-3 related protein
MEAPNTRPQMDLDRLLELLRRTYDVQDWWPSDSPFEVMVGAILTQQTTWESVAKVLHRLRNEGLLNVERMDSIDIASLESILRPLGFYRQKAKRIKGLASYIVDRHGSDPGRLLNGPTDSVRNELLSLEGIGKETADSILVFGAGRAKFVAAAYSSRVLKRTGVLCSADYDEVQSFVESNLRGGPKEFHDLYALMVQLSKDLCRPVPHCDRCPLSPECLFFIGPGRR